MGEWKKILSMHRKCAILIILISLFVLVPQLASAESMLSSVPSNLGNEKLSAKDQQKQLADDVTDDPQHHTGVDSDSTIIPSPDSQVEKRAETRAEKKDRKKAEKEARKKHRKRERKKDQKKEITGDSSKKSNYPSIQVHYNARESGKYNSRKRKRRHSSKKQESGDTIDITPIIVREADKNGISPTLLKAIIDVESGFNTFAVGYGGAQGLCQLIPSTARSLGVSDPFNPEQNIAGGAKYLGDLNKRFRGDTDRVLAGYNLGPGAVKSRIPRRAYRFINLVKQRMKW
jgi:hypothetical protein